MECTASFYTTATATTATSSFSHLLTIMFTSILLAATGLAAAALASYDSSCSNNVVTYWGQNSWGGAHLDDPAHWEGTLASYCQDDTFDVINISFLTNFNLTGLPVLNHAFHCETVFENTNTLHCPDIGADIKTCQKNGKKIVLSLGGGNIYTYGLSSDAQGQAFADTVWDMFLGGSSQYRPYNDAVLDGVDLDIESGEHTGYVAFINQLRSRFQKASKQYIISAAPQCVYPDRNLGSTLQAAWIDNDYVQFYNNPCNLANIDNKWNFDYASWDTLTKKNPNPNSKMYVGLPAGTGAAGNGYLELSTLKADLNQLYTNFTSTFGGIMLWDASWSSNNKAYVQSLSSWVKENMKCGSTSPPTSTSFYPTTSQQPPPTSSTIYTSVPPKTSSTFIPSTLTSIPPPTSTSAPSQQCTAANNGSYMCESDDSSPLYRICNNGSWIKESCASGTVCRQSGTTIYCDWP